MERTLQARSCLVLAGRPMDQGFIAATSRNCAWKRGARAWAAHRDSAVFTRLAQYAKTAAAVHGG